MDRFVLIFEHRRVEKSTKLNQPITQCNFIILQSSLNSEIKVWSCAQFMEVQALSSSKGPFWFLWPYEIMWIRSGSKFVHVLQLHILVFFLFDRQPKKVWLQLKLGSFLPSLISWTSWHHQYLASLWVLTNT